MKIAFVLYPGFTALDLIGPFQVLASIPGHDAVFVAAELGPIADDTGRCPLTATTTFAEMAAPDVVIVGGSSIEHQPQANAVDWLRAVHPDTAWTVSVCTGSTYLAAAGIITGREATCHWARADQLERLGARYVPTRVVRDGKIITAAGVSAGIDMALGLVDQLHGRDMAEVMQLAIEYDPQPPFDAGSPATARPEIVEIVRAAMSPTTGTSASNS